MFVHASYVIVFFGVTLAFGIVIDDSTKKVQDGRGDEQCVSQEAKRCCYSVGSEKREIGRLSGAGDPDIGCLASCRGDDDGDLRGFRGSMWIDPGSVEPYNFSGSASTTGAVVVTGRTGVW